MSDAPRAQLSPGEMEIMAIVWDRGEAAAQEIRDVLSKRRDLSRNTVRTMLARMEEKGWVRHRIVSQTFFYSPVIPREKGLGQRLLDIVDKVCGGQPERLLNALIEYRGLTAEEIDRLRGMLDATEPKRPAKRRKKT